MFSQTFPGPGFASAWAQSYQLTDTLSADFSICFFKPQTNTVQHPAHSGLFYYIVRSLQRLNGRDTWDVTSTVRVSHQEKLWCFIPAGCTGLGCLRRLWAKTTLTTSVMCVLSGCSKQKNVLCLKFRYRARWEKMQLVLKQNGLIHRQVNCVSHWVIYWAEMLKHWLLVACWIWRFPDFSQSKVTVNILWRSSVSQTDCQGTV